MRDEVNQRYAFRVIFGLLVFALAICAGSTSQVRAADGVRSIAYTGLLAPGSPNYGYYYAFYLPPTINNQGDIAFTARDSNNDYGIWVERSQSLSSIVREGDAVAGTTGTFNTFGAPTINELGEVSFTANHSTLPHYAGIWRTEGATLRKVVDVGDTAPGTGWQFGPPSPSPVHQILSSPPSFNDANASTFWAELNVPAQIRTWSFWLNSNNSHQRLAQDRERAPDTPSPIEFRLDPYDDILLNNAGQVAFEGGLINDATTQGGGIFFGTPNNLKVVARTGTQVPGLAVGVKYHPDGAPGDPSLNARGQVLFNASIAGGGVTTDNDSGIWLYDDGQYDLIAREGSPAFDTPAGVNFAYLGWAYPLLNNNGQMVFRGGLTGDVQPTNDSALWVGPRDDLQILAREGDVAPDVTDGAKFAAFVYPYLNDFSINALGQVAFLGNLTGDGVTSLNDQGIWASDVSGQLHLIAREGDAIEIFPGMFRTIAELDYAAHSNNEDGRASGFNDLGQLVFRATFNDGTSGLFVSDLVAVPEPASLALLALGGVAVVWIGARRTRR